MKKTFLFSALLLTALLAQISEAASGSISKAGDEPTDTIMGKSIPMPVLEAYHNGEIKKIDMRTYKDKWIVLFFYPADFTFVCPTELKELSDYYADFTSGGAEILSISTDSAYVHRAWHRENALLKNVKFPMLSDRSGAFSRALGVYESSKGTSIRAAFIVDPDGKIVAAEYTSDSIGRNAGELLRKLDAAIAVRKGGGGFCPAGWVEGSELIHGE